MVKSIFDANPANLSRDDIILEAWLKKDGVDKRIRVEFSRIAYRQDNGDGTSSIVLTDGNEIKTLLSLDDLDAKIASHSLKDGAVVDLKSITGEKAIALYNEQNILQLFNAEAERQDSMVIRFYGFQRVGKDITDISPMIIREKDIKIWEEDKTFNRPTEIGFIGLDDKPAGSQYFFLFMPIEKLQKRVAEAKAAGLKTLDLLEATRPPAREKCVILATQRIIS